MFLLLRLSVSRYASVSVRLFALSLSLSLSLSLLIFLYFMSESLSCRQSCCICLCLYTCCTSLLPHVTHTHTRTHARTHARTHIYSHSCTANLKLHQVALITICANIPLPGITLRGTYLFSFQCGAACLPFICTLDGCDATRSPTTDSISCTASVPPLCFRFGLLVFCRGHARCNG